MEHELVHMSYIDEMLPTADTKCLNREFKNPTACDEMLRGQNKFLEAHH
jgi:hypothetical protein